MVRTRKTRPRTVSQAVPLSQTARSVDPVPGCADLHEWPQRWMGVPDDLPPGQHIVECFRPFLQHLSERQLSAKTLRKHVNNLWALGGQIIRDLNDTPSLRHAPIDVLVFNAVEDGGLLPYGSDSEDALRSFESTCRLFRRFLEQQPR